MQIVRTEISPATAATGEPLIRVVFCGEGGDRARAILVQIATFGVAANDYEARSNGNFDEVAVTTASNENGGVYIFEYRDGEGSRQVPPSTMLSFEAARQEAIRCAIIDLLVDPEPGTDPLTSWLVRVRNGSALCHRRAGGESSPPDRAMIRVSAFKKYGQPPPVQALANVACEYRHSRSSASAWI